MNHRLVESVAVLPESLQESVSNWFERAAAVGGDRLKRLGRSGCDTEELVRVLACSEFAARVLERSWDWFLSQVEGGGMTGGVDRAGLVQQFESLEDSLTDRDRFMRNLRRLRNQTLVKILWGDLVGGRPLNDTLEALSDFADCAVGVAVDFATRQLGRRFGNVAWNGEPMPLVVVAMGKLGGRELNFSSDIDLVFLYPGDGMTDGDRSISAQEYFTRVVRIAASVLEEATADGFVYRVDTRLRPFGDSGSPVLGFAGLESYLLQHGRSWERYAYVKARVIVPTHADGLSQALMRDIVRPFVYRRYLDYGVFESLREMKALVAAEVRKREMQDNVKLGPGGIREIEFIVQALQLVRGGSVPGLRTTQLRTALKNAVDDHDLTAATAARLLRAYEFLRRIENYLQAYRDQQTHELPAGDTDRDRLAYAMRFSTWADFERVLIAERKFVSSQFAAIAFRASANEADSVRASEFEALWSTGAPAGDWSQLFARRGFEESRELAELITSFAAMPSTRRVDSIAARRLRQFVPAMLRLLGTRPGPAVILKRILGIVDRVLRRSAYLALLNENRVVLERLVDLCATSGYLAGEVARFPVLLDELIDARRYARAPDKSEIRADLEQRIGAVDAEDVERQVQVLAGFKRATLFRLAVADFSGSISVMKVSDRLTDLAELVLSRALSLAHADLVARFGEPRYRLANREHQAGLGVIAYGKLGGMELSYGSDLDIVFLHDSRGGQQQTDGLRSIDNSVFFGRLARRLVHFLTTQTESGRLYNIDTRLRPSGRAGLLVTSIDGFERYQEENAWTWEHQALLRGRAVAGSSVVAREFERIRARTLRYRVRRDQLRDDVVAMRAKMRTQLDKSSKERFDLKQGPGGVADIEFLVQFLVLSSAEQHPAVIHYTDNIRQLGALAAAGCLSESESRRLQETYRRYRARMHRLALDERPSFADGDAFAEERAFVRGLWRRELGD